MKLKLRERERGEGERKRNKHFLVIFKVHILASFCGFGGGCNGGTDGGGSCGYGY